MLSVNVSFLMESENDRELECDIAANKCEFNPVVNIEIGFELLHK